MTKEERRLRYDFLKTLPWTVNRQKVIGKYIVDFYIAKANIVIELDGSQHYQDDENMVADRKRDTYLNAQGIKVLRYTNLDVLKRFKEVCQDIENNIAERLNTSSTASGPPSPQGEG